MILTDFTLQDIIINSTKLQDLLANYSIPYSLSKELLNATVSGKQVTMMIPLSIHSLFFMSCMIVFIHCITQKLTHSIIHEFIQFVFY